MMKSHSYELRSRSRTRPGRLLVLINFRGRASLIIPRDSPT